MSYVETILHMTYLKMVGIHAVVVIGVATFVFKYHWFANPTMPRSSTIQYVARTLSTWYKDLLNTCKKLGMIHKNKANCFKNLYHVPLHFFNIEAQVSDTLDHLFLEF